MKDKKDDSIQAQSINYLFLNNISSIPKVKVDINLYFMFNCLLHTFISMFQYCSVNNFKH